MSDRIVVMSEMTNRPLINVDGEVIWFACGMTAIKFFNDNFAHRETQYRVVLMPENREFMYTWESKPTVDPYVDEFDL